MNIPLLLKPKGLISYINENSTVRQGVEKMKFHGYAALPVINDEGEYTGTVTEGDFLWHFLNTKNDAAPAKKYLIKDISPFVNLDINVKRDRNEIFNNFFKSNNIISHNFFDIINFVSHIFPMLIIILFHSI